MLKKQTGFAHLGVVVVAVLVLAAVGFAGWRVQKAQHKSRDASAAQKQTQSDQPLLLKSIGFNLGYYDAATNHAGDMVFTHEDHDLSGGGHVIFADFGTQDFRSPNDP
ncbi:MAG TPA: hypothetical protein VLF40_05600, partial [Candidatus Saccharimonadales bacterium]|nr:hypothetical protein [Candidatus Saccharimonadales bacterium]